MEDKFFTPQEVAKMLKVSYMTILRWIISGKLKANKVGRQYRIKKVELELFIDKQQ